jgi:hypothetical protein
VEKRASQLEMAALSAETARVLCVGILRDGGAQFIHDDDNEAQLLRDTWAACGCKEADEVFVTFNGNRFDWPMLTRRSYILGVTVPNWLPREGRWIYGTNYDLFALWQLGDRSESISLDRLARLCGLSGKTGSGADFARLWKDDRKAALDYLELDLELTRALWQKMVL